MKYFLAVYLYKTRPMYRKGTLKEQQITFAANSYMDALRMAKEHGKKIFRGQWSLYACTETTLQPNAKEVSAVSADRRVEKLVSNKVLRQAVSKKAGQG